MTSPYLTLKARTEAQARQASRNHPNRGAAARRLRDAAPDLLAALNALFAVCYDLERDDDTIAAVAAARAAIAKATGEA